MLHLHEVVLLYLVTVTNSFMFNTWYVYYIILFYLTNGSKEKNGKLKIKMGTSSSNCRFKMTPPILNKEHGYSTWNHDLSIWEAFSSLVSEKQDLAVFRTLTGQDKEAVRNICVENLSPGNGLKLIIEELDKL